MFVNLSYKKGFKSLTLSIYIVVLIEGQLKIPKEETVKEPSDPLAFRGGRGWRPGGPVSKIKSGGPADPFPRRPEPLWGACLGMGRREHLGFG